jgi:hypothetical protein
MKDDPAEAAPKPIPGVARKRQLSNEVCCGVIREWRRRGRDSSSETGATNHARRTWRL